ncbi:MAG: hypothetical protein CMA08_04510 [Euryarchaeota archaeon]|nr:hypothetical protein [Euryarchaeota archaeon]OUX21381.1 MAG: hypothetical protein CBE12_04445 [Euryarchaeota archaeon TMED252]
MVGLVLLAGGQSRRMGRDKARMFGGLQRILSEAKAAGLTPRIVLAGLPPRKSEFEHEGCVEDADHVLDDPDGATCLHDVLVHVLDGTLPAMVLTPCDAVHVDRRVFSRLAAMDAGVPLDDEGRRQVLFSHLPEGWKAAPSPTQHVEALFEALEDREVPSIAGDLQSANTPEELVALASLKGRSFEGNGA